MIKIFADIKTIRTVVCIHVFMCPGQLSGQSNHRSSFLRGQSNHRSTFLSGQSNHRSPLLIGQSNQRSSFFYQGRFQMYWDNRILLKCPSYLTTFILYDCRDKARYVGTTQKSPPWKLRRLANVSPFFNSLSNRLRITNEFQSWSVTYDYTLSYQISSQYLKS
jgi:hypothetical protein